MLQSCPTLCDTIDGSPPGSPVPGILQARVLEWVAIAFSKLTLGQNINVKVSLAVTALMNSQGHKWLTNSRMTHYEELLCKNPQVQLETVWTLNPSTFLPTEAGILNHNCEELIDEIYSSRPDLMDTPLQNPELELTEAVSSKTGSTK